MNDNILLNIAIPTYNRVTFLESLLVCLAPQVEGLHGLVKICISDNCSTDNTGEIVAIFQKKYPDLINYGKNEDNLGADANIIKVIDMAKGEFIWLLGDDDLVVGGGVEKVVNFINNHCGENTGVIMLRQRLCLEDDNSSMRGINIDTTEKDKPEMYRMDIESIMGTNSGSSFLSLLILNNNFVKKIIKEESKEVEKAVGTYFMHAFLYQLMLLKYPHLEAIRFNEVIICEGPHYRKSYVEDEFVVFYAARKKLDGLLLRSRYITDICRQAILAEQKLLKWIIIRQMGVMKAFNNFNFNSFFGCLGLFFRNATIPDASIMAFFFIFFNILPSSIMKNMYKNFVRIKYKKKWKEIWLHNVAIFDRSKYSRRLI